jgi:DNA-binding transcriptional LysR family regulator
MKPLDLTRFDLNLLVVLEALWVEKHVGRAAERLHLSQSATSHALSRLRTAFDDQLFIRNPRGIAPTPLAIELMPRVAAVLESVRLVASPRGPFDPSRLQATLSVAATDHAVMTVIAPALARIQAAAPQAVLKLSRRMSSPLYVCWTQARSTSCWGRVHLPKFRSALSAS